MRLSLSAVRGVRPSNRPIFLSLTVPNEQLWVDRRSDQCSLWGLMRCIRSVWHAKQ